MCKEALLCFLVGQDTVAVAQMSEISNLDPSADRYQNSRKQGYPPGRMGSAMGCETVLFLPAVSSCPV
jgi:hypothetical protein